MPNTVTNAAIATKGTLSSGRCLSTSRYFASTEPQPMLFAAHPFASILDSSSELLPSEAITLALKMLYVNPGKAPTAPAIDNIGGVKFSHDYDKQGRYVSIEKGEIGVRIRAEKSKRPLNPAVKHGDKIHEAPERSEAINCALALLFGAEAPQKPSQKYSKGEYSVFAYDQYQLMFKTDQDQAQHVKLIGPGGQAAVIEKREVETIQLSPLDALSQAIDVLYVTSLTKPGSPSYHGTKGGVTFTHYSDENREYVSIKKDHKTITLRPVAVKGAKDFDNKYVESTRQQEGKLDALLCAVTLLSQKPLQHTPTCIEYGKVFKQYHFDQYKIRLLENNQPLEYVEFITPDKRVTRIELNSD